MILLIDGATTFLELALINNENKIVDSYFEIQNKNLTKILVKNISNILEKNKINKSDIKKIYVVNGPGSFTSIKLISTLANTWKEIYEIKLFEINTCLFYSTSINSFSFLDAKSNMYYCQKIDNNNSKIELLHKKEFDKLKDELFLKKYLIIDCSVKQNINEKWEFNKNNFKEVDKVVPLYLKEAI